MTRLAAMTLACDCASSTFYAKLGSGDVNLTEADVEAFRARLEPFGASLEGADPADAKTAVEVYREVFGWLRLNVRPVL